MDVQFPYNLEFLPDLMDFSSQLLKIVKIWLYEWKQIFFLPLPFTWISGVWTLDYKNATGLLPHIAGKRIHLLIGVKMSKEAEL